MRHKTNRELGVDWDVTDLAAYLSDEELLSHVRNSIRRDTDPSVRRVLPDSIHHARILIVQPSGDTVRLVFNKALASHLPIVFASPNPIPQNINVQLSLAEPRKVKLDILNVLEEQRGPIYFNLGRSSYIYTYATTAEHPDRIRLGPVDSMDRYHYYGYMGLGLVEPPVVPFETIIPHTQRQR